ncbi:MAG: ShlB/FhaC/HecB family hemolysin secretion/activation protein [Rhodocyclaceae bacterium]|nr:ShlB/FhaC/HecB family hemolysin secretion/activation protein [Rhodocyclaceae bacterium]
MHNKDLIAVAAALVATAAYGVEPDHLNDQEPARPGYLQRQPAAPFSLPPLAPDGSPVAPGARPVLLDHVRFVGNTVVSTADLQAVAAPFVGKTLSAADIETLREKATLLYVERGYVNSGAVLAADALDHGTLTLHIVEGRLKEVRLRGLGRLNEHYVVDRLAKDDEVFNILTLGERFQLLLTDPLFARMNGQLMPAAERGKAILDVDVERALPYQLTLAANNYRPVSIGAQSATLGGWVRNLTGYGDTLELSYQGPLGDGNADRKALGWRVPVNSVGTQIAVNYDTGVSSVIEQPIQPLDIESHLVNKDVGVSQTLFESLTQKFGGGVNRVVREDRTTMLGVPFSFVPGESTGTSRAWDWRYWLEYSHRWENQVVALRATFTHGDNNQLDAGAVPGATIDRRYRIWLGQAQYARRIFDDGTQFIVRLSVQDTPQHLIAMEAMSVGGVNTVRGYRENQLVRDNGAVTNVELDIPVIADGARKFSLNLVPFFDHGRAQNNGADPVVISSLGLATRLRWQGLAVDLAAAARLYHPASITRAGSNLQDKGIHVQVSYNFF